MGDLIRGALRQRNQWLGNLGESQVDWLSPARSAPHLEEVFLVDEIVHEPSSAV